MLEEIRNERIKKLKLLHEKGVDAYPAATLRTHTISEIKKDFSKYENAKTDCAVAGRILSLREHGGIIFIDLFDGVLSEKLGVKNTIQALFKKDTLDESYELFMHTADIGDFVEVGGICFTTKRGEETIEVRRWNMLAKSLLPLPEKWHGLQDTEERYRKRYLDILMDDAVRSMFEKKSRFWESARNFLHTHGFLEVETPVLEPLPGGADAEPFLTHLNALNIDLYLRIAPELYLKRLLVGGFEKIFEIGRVFRNEGIDREHLQDYTQLEFYWAYADYQVLMKFIEELYKKIVFDTLGSHVHAYAGQTIDWSKPWRTYDYYSVMLETAGIDLTTATEETVQQKAEENGLDHIKHIGRGRVIDLVFKKLVRHKLVEPGFLINPPVDVEPLAKRLGSDPGRVQRIQVIACGTELGKGFSELNDPLDQKERMEKEARLREAGDKEAQRMDEDFLEALEYGMPPAAGFGFSERLFSVLVDKPVRETTFFPLMRPHKTSL